MKFFIGSVVDAFVLSAVFLIGGTAHAQTASNYKFKNDDIEIKKSKIDNVNMVGNNLRDPAPPLALSSPGRFVPDSHEENKLLQEKINLLEKKVIVLEKMLAEAEAKRKQ